MWLSSEENGYCLERSEATPIQRKDIAVSLTNEMDVFIALLYGPHLINAPISSSDSTQRFLHIIHAPGCTTDTRQSLGITASPLT